MQPRLPEGDQRVSGQRQLVTPHNKLTEVERKAVMDILNSAEFKDLPPSQIVPRLADQKIYLASESTMLRLLQVAGQLKHRRAERARHNYGLNPVHYRLTPLTKSTVGTLPTSLLKCGGSNSICTCSWTSSAARQ